MAKTAQIKRYWGQPVEKQGKIWKTEIREPRIRKNEPVKVGLNSYLIKDALHKKATLKVSVRDQDVFFQVPAWKWHAHATILGDVDYQRAKFHSRGTKVFYDQEKADKHGCEVGKPYLPIYLFPIPERAYKRNRRGMKSTDKAANKYRVEEAEVGHTRSKPLQMGFAV